MFCTGSSVPRCVISGLAGLLSNGPCGDRDRAMVTACPRSVPPSAMSRYHQLADPVEVRALGELAAGARPQPAALGQHLAGQRVDRRLDDALAALRAEAGVGHQAGAVVVPGEVGVDAHRRRDAHRLRPRAGRVLGVHEQLAAVVGPVRRDHPEPAVVVAQRRREDPARRAGLRDVELRRAGPATWPICSHERRSVDRKIGTPGRVLEAASDQVVGVADPADARVGVEAGDHRPLDAHAGTTTRFPATTSAIRSRHRPTGSSSAGWLRKPCSTPGTEHLPDVDTGQRQRGGEGLARGPEAVVLGVDHHASGRARRARPSAGMAYPSAELIGPPR